MVLLSLQLKDASGSGFISPKDFYDIMTSIKSHLLTDIVRTSDTSREREIKNYTTSISIFFSSLQVKQNLVDVTQMSADPGEHKRVSYPYFVAFVKLLANIELVKKIYLNATNGSRTMEINKGGWGGRRFGPQAAPPPPPQKKKTPPQDYLEGDPGVFFFGFFFFGLKRWGCS